MTFRDCNCNGSKVGRSVRQKKALILKHKVTAHRWVTGDCHSNRQKKYADFLTSLRSTVHWQYTFEPREGSCKIILSCGQFTQMQKQPGLRQLTKGRVLSVVYELRN